MNIKVKSSLPKIVISNLSASLRLVLSAATAFQMEMADAKFPPSSLHKVTGPMSRRVIKIESMSGEGKSVSRRKITFGGLPFARVRCIIY